MNNTPLVIIAIPVIQALASQVKISSSKIMMPLSYIAILGGMTTLVGSSTNMLVSTTMEDLGYQTFSFFQFTIPGAMLASVGAFYVLVILPYMLPKRHSMSEDLQGDDVKKFTAEITISEGSKFIGQSCTDGLLPNWSDIELRIVHRDHDLIVPPFDDYTIESGDILIVIASSKTLMDMLATQPGYLLSKKANNEEESSVSNALHNNSVIEEETNDNEIKEDEELSNENYTHTLSELMIKPNSRLLNHSIDEIDFEDNFNCVVLGVQRHARVIRRRLGQMRLQSGDVLLVVADNEAIKKLRNDTQDLIVLSGSRQDIPVGHKARHAGLIFLATVSSAAFGILPISVAAITGAVAMVLSGCLNIEQTMRAFDRKIFFLVGASLALGTTLQTTGGATFLANMLLSLPIAQEPFYAATLLFIIVAIATNLLSNNACAVLFTPVAINLALELGQDPFVFAMTIIFAANCSFASPIGYQTNLLVMGPGHYQFSDFIKAGIPLILILWATYCLIAKYYFGL